MIFHKEDTARLPGCICQHHGPPKGEQALLSPRPMSGALGDHIGSSWIFLELGGMHGVQKRLLASQQGKRVKFLESDQGAR